MKRLSTYDKANILKRYCQHSKCNNCCLVDTDYCQKGNETAYAVNEAYGILTSSKKYLKGKKEKKC